MKFQLVFQFDADSLEDFKKLEGLEDIFVAALATDKKSAADGYDLAKGEFNLFLKTDSPRPLFILVADAIRTKLPDLPFRAGYRVFEEEHFIPLWPPSISSFKVSRDKYYPTVEPT